jgi:hypothetical protein
MSKAAPSRGHSKQPQDGKHFTVSLENRQSRHEGEILAELQEDMKRDDRKGDWLYNYNEKKRLGRPIWATGL